MRVTVPTQDDMRPKPVIPGLYTIIYSKYSFKVSEKGNPMLWITFEIRSQGANPDDNTIGRKFTDGYLLNEDGFWKLNALVIACTGHGLDAGDMEVEDLINKAIADITNVEILAQLEIDTYQGNPRNRIKGEPTAKAA